MTKRKVDPPCSFVHHIALGARDVECVASFYELTLGLERDQAHFDQAGQLRSVWLFLGASNGQDPARLMIEKTNDSNVLRPDLGVSPGWFLLAFVVSAVDRPTLEQRIEAAGSVLEHRTEHSTYARDPEGNRFAISCYPLMRFSRPA